MTTSKSLLRKSHFLGTKIRNLRKRNNLTMEDLSTRCIRIDPEYAPSVSYLSMIERGKRVPSVEMLTVIAQVFQKEPEWFLDGEEQQLDITPTKGSRGGIHGMALEPGFLFSNDILQIAIPEMLSQTGISGKQFAQLLIRAHQEHHQNHFPELERAAEEVGLKRMPLSVEDLLAIVKQLGLSISWFDEAPKEVLDELGVLSKNVSTSFFLPPKTLHLNRLLKNHPTRLKYELAVHIGHAVLHNKDGVKSGMTVGGAQEVVDSDSPDMAPQDILHAWRDFESSFFAGALLCPKMPFRQLLDRHGYEISTHQGAGVSASVAMRRMTAVSPYHHWHYFDAYTPGKLKAVYRGNGIPLPWGNMRKVEDPCQHWAVFRMFDVAGQQSSAQLSLLEVQGQPRIYCCESTKVLDLAGNAHVLCAGIDLNPAIDAQGMDADAMAQELKALCNSQGGAGKIPPAIKSTLSTVANILNINWVARSLEKPAQMICSRGNHCPREPACYQRCGMGAE
jgi:transcriptional regulator with XRE-family HTH domain